MSIVDIHIGRPIANTQVYIVDKYMNAVPIGIIGELCIAGDGVGAGYLNRPELTAEKFVDNPFGEGKLYKTGDLAYWREDGNIAYVGRNDFQVKIRGLRIELGEIENAIDSIDGISQAVVVVRKNNEGRQLICAFYTGAVMDSKEIRNHIGKKLPKYMLPHIFTHLKEMPLTGSGKVNRKALPEVDLYAIENTVEYVTPTTEKEKILVAAIETVIGGMQVSVIDNFFEIGGDSMMAIELISELEKQGYHTDTKTIFNSETVKELAEKLGASESTEDAIDCTGDIPATDAQLRVYTAQSMNSDSAIYNVSYAFKVEHVDIDCLQNAVDELINRHESLRTYFENRNGHIIQVVNDVSDCPVEILKTDDIAAFVRPFDLGVAPLLRVGVYENTVMIDMHHIITDGSSMPVLLQELNELYMGRSLMNTPAQYRQFALQRQDHTESEKYWLSVYGDDVPVLEINTDFHRGQKQSFKGSVIYDIVESKLHNQVLAFCKEQNITPYVFYMGAFNILLSKFSGNEDIVVGMPISGRSSKYLNTIGMFVNTIALRNQPVGTKSVADFLREVKANSVAAMEYQNYPYGELVKKLHLDTPGRNPLFDVMFAYQSEQMTDVVFGDRKAELLPLPMTTAKYDFTFHMLPQEECIVIMAEYCTDLYKQTTIQRFVDSYKHILEQMLTPTGLLSHISAMRENEINTLLYVFNNTAKNYPNEKCIHELFEEQVTKIPNKAAVIARDEMLTYSQLNEQANQIAHSLIEKGIGIGDIVAFALPRKCYLISTMLGILKAGAVYLPIDSDYPQERIDYILEDSQAKLFITEDNIANLIANSSITNPEIHMSSNDLCYCLFTSGSTGKPKGALLKHKGIVNLVTDLGIYDNLSGCERIGFMTTITFDVATQEILTAILNGFTGVLMPERKETRAEEIISGIIENGIDMMYATPTYFDALTDTQEKAERLLSAIKVVCLAGEKFYLNTNVLSMKDKFNVIFENQYGPVETHVTTTSTLKDIGNITIGQPIANTQIYIVDRYLQPVPVGVTGELCIAGSGVGAGYLSRPELTAEKFIDNPFGEGMLYKTGDLAYWCDDGNIAYVGRNDFQVKVRGLRIELGEIENAIDSIDGISQAVVVVRKNNEGRQLICAFYTGAEIDAKEIRNQIGTKLPKYMLPHVFIHLDEMPLTNSGKISRKALPGIDLEKVANDTEYIPPENEQQKILCGMMEQILDITPVGIADDFFDLGGDSLKAIELLSKAHSEGIYFNLQNIFDYPTVKELLECIKNGDKLEVSFADVDFAPVNAILEKNKEEYITIPPKHEVGNMLLAGATGYLGIHILADFLENDTGTAYCLVRGKDQSDSVLRLNELLEFYFDGKYIDSKRIQVICADLQRDNFGLNEDTYAMLLSKVDTVVNAAANVKHYGTYKYFYEVNVETVKRLISFCKASNAVLIHSSTMSVSGNSFGDDYGANYSGEEIYFKESTLYFGQPLDNVYARSKFEAEKTVLDAMVDGLKANIMRLGQLTNRTDGVFQKNHKSNAYLKRMKAMLDMGIIPENLADKYTEFTPIDKAAHAIMTIARHFSDQQTVFHIENHKFVSMQKLTEIFAGLGWPIKCVAQDDFSRIITDLAQDPERKYIVETFINELDDENRLSYDSNIHVDLKFTVAYLRTLGFEWPDIGVEYLRKYIEYFEVIGYLKERAK